MTTEPAVKTREARRMVGLRPKRSQKGPATSENSHAAPTLRSTRKPGSDPEGKKPLEKPLENPPETQF